MAHIIPAPSSSSIITYKWTYDVFLSFHGGDTRLGFTSYLHQSLCRTGIRAFLDDECIRTGENITPALFRAIQESRIAIVVFSENYASSTFCLQELEKILECFKEENRLIYPVFYYVDPSELRRPRGSYARALAQMEKRFKGKCQKVKKWRLALSQVADLKGCHLKPKIANEQECITKITNEVAAKINHVKVSVESKTQEIEDKKEVHFGVHVYNLQSNLANIRFMDPRRYVVDHNLLQNIQEQQDWEELEKDMGLDSNSIKAAEKIENSMHYRDQPQYREELEDFMHQDSDSVKSTEYQEERDMMNRLQPDWDLETGTAFPTWLGNDFSCQNLIELRLVNCKNCQRIPTLGQLPSLRSLTIKRLQSVFTVGSEFFKEDDCASSSVPPFPSLETLSFGNMNFWEEWHNSIDDDDDDMEAFPKLRTLSIYDCPKLIGNLPPRLVSLEFLQITACPLLASYIPKSPKLHHLHIIQSQNVVLQEPKLLPPCLRSLGISGARMLKPLSEKLHIEYLYVRDCSSDAMPLLVIHMPPSVKMLNIVTSENLKFVLVSKVPLVHLRRISICRCKFLRSLFDDMERLLPNLRELSISGCPELEPFSSSSAGLLPSSLKQLDIRDCDKLLSCDSEWHQLPSITKLIISTPSQTFHCRGLQHLSSLQELQIWYSPRLERIEGGIMPPSLQRLLIWGGQLLEARCRSKDDEIWPKISHVPYISLGGTRL